MSSTPDSVDVTQPDDGGNKTLFSGNLTTLVEVWLAITIWNGLTLGAVYLLVGVVGVRVAGWKFRNAVILPATMALLGMISGAAQGALSAIGVALVYNSGGFIMEWHMAAVWGASFSGLYLLVTVLQNFIQW